MADATQAIATLERAGDLVEVGVKAATTLHAGTIAAVDANGHAVPASKTAGITVLGRVERSAANTAAGADDGDVKALIKRKGAFRWKKADGGTEPTIAHVGKAGYAEDNQTVGNSNAGNAPEVGTIIAVEDGGVWVDLG